MSSNPAAATPEDVEELRRSVQRLSHMLGLLRHLASELDLDRLLRRIIAQTTETLGAERSTLFLVDYDKDQLWSRVAEGDGMAEIRIPRSAGIAGHVASTGETLNIPVAYQDPRFNPEVDRRTGFRTRSILCMPVLDSDGTIVGVVQVLNKKLGAFTREDEDLLQAVSSQAVIALKNAALFDEVVRTKNYNESILRSMATGVVALDNHGRVTSLNPAAQRILGFESYSPVGRAFEDAIRAEENAALAEPVRSALQQGESRQAQKLRYQTDQGAQVTMNLSAVPLLNAKHEQIGLVTVIEDISREQQLMGTLSRVVSRQVAEQLVAQGDVPMFEGSRKKVTVLMSDIRGFTTLSESMPPEDVVRLLNDYFGRMIDVIFKHEGTLDKFIGDAIMAVFGAPAEHKDDPMRAVHAGIEMRQRLWEFNQEQLANGKPTIEIGVGIAGGEAVSGAIGSEERMDFTVIGDTVNTAARLEGITKEFPEHKIVMNESVYEFVKHEIPCDFLSEHYVKGKAQAVRLYGIPESFVRGWQPPSLG